MHEDNSERHESFDSMAKEYEEYERFERELEREASEDGESGGGAEGKTAQDGPPRFYSELYEWVETLSAALLAVVLLFTFAVRTITVDGPSMNRTLTHGDSLMITQLLREPRPGDIVAVTKLDATNRPLIKRVIAVGGQTLDIDGETGDVYVDGALLDEPYIAEHIAPNPFYDVDYPMVIPEGSIFIMGDNRNNSWDSRSELGPVDERHVLGRVVWRYFPFGGFGNPGL